MPVDYSRYEPDWVKEFKRCEKWLEDALDYAHGTFDINDVFNDVVNGTAQFWPGKNSAVVTQIVPYPRKKVLHFFLAGGDIKELEEMENEFGEFRVYTVEICLECCWNHLVYSFLLGDGNVRKPPRRQATLEDADFISEKKMKSWQIHAEKLREMKGR